MDRTTTQAHPDAVNDRRDGIDETSLPATRPYRSKVQRPCDLCRRRKVHCSITNPSQPCRLCERLDRSCTFLEQAHRKCQQEPSTRTFRQGQGQEEVQEHAQEKARGQDVRDQARQEAQGREREQEQEHIAFVGGERMGGSHETAQYNINNDHVREHDGGPPLSTWERTSIVQQNSQITRDSPVATAREPRLGDIDCYIDDSNVQFPDPERADDRQAAVGCIGLMDISGAIAAPDAQGIESLNGRTHAGLEAMDERPTKRQRRDRLPPPNRSLDMCRDYTSQLFGLSGESDPYLLNFYPYGKNQEFRFSKVIYRRLEEPGDDPSASCSLPTQFLLSHDSITTAALARSELDATNTENGLTDREELDRLINEDHRVPLFEMYVQHSIHRVHADYD
jgi:hypothetical protein